MATADLHYLSLDEVARRLKSRKLSSVEATRAIRAASPATQVVLLTSFEDAQQIVAAVQAGALSCLLKDVDADALRVRRPAVSGARAPLLRRTS